MDKEVRQDEKTARLEEDLEMARFALLLHKALEAEAEVLETERQSAVADPKYQVSEELDRRCQRTLKKELGRKARRKTFRKVYTIAAYAAVFFVCAAIGLFILVTQVEAVRVPVLSYFLEILPDRAIVHTTSDDIFPVPKWIPQGFSLTYESKDTRMYENGNGIFITYDYFGINGRQSFDSEDADVIEDVSIAGFQGTLILKGSDVILFWLDTKREVFFSIIATSAENTENIDWETVSLIAESIY